MKKIGLIILLTLSFLLLTNCNKDKKKETVAVEYENKNPKIKFSDDTYILFEKFAENKKDIMQKLKTLNKDEANKLYEQYVEDNENILYKIVEATEKFLDSIYYGSAEEQFTEKDWNDTNKILNKYDLELWDIGEGMVTIRELPHLYYDVFKDYVTDDYKEYLKIWAKDHEELYQADAGLSISFEELGDRIARWENFLNKYPNSILKPKVTALLNSYREDYISKVNVLLEIRKKKTIRDILSILANLIYFLVYYVIVIACFVGIIFLRKRNVFEELKTLMLNVNTAGSFATMLVLLFVFANLIFLLALTLFNNTNLAISFSLLYFIGGEVIANMIKSRFSVPAERIDNSVLTIFTKSFNLLNQNITFSLGNFLPLVLNMLGLIVVIVIVRLMKKIIG